MTDETTPEAAPEPGAAPPDTLPVTPEAQDPATAVVEETPADWRAGLAEELRGSPALKDVADVADLAKQYIDAQAYVGNSIRIPSEHASAEDHAAFRAKLAEKVPGLAELKADDPEAFKAAMKQLGAPGKPDGYKMPEFEGVDPESLKPLPGFNEWAVEADLTQAQYEMLARRFTESSLENNAQVAAEHNAALEALRHEWGYAYDDKVQRAADVAQLTGAPEAMVEAVRSGRMNAADLKWLANLAETYGDEASINAGKQTTPRELTPREAQAQLDEIMSNREHPYWKATPGSREKVQALDDVMRLKTLSLGKDGREKAASFGYSDDAA